MAELSDAFHQLYLLTGERNPAVHWQVFCDYDHSRKDLARSYYGTLSKLAPVLKSAQDQGCGVFVSVNEFRGARKKEDLFGIRGLFLDFDSAPLPDDWPELPDLILNTSPGKHQCLWILDPARAEVALWRCLQRSLQERYGADKHCRGNVCQVMRVAGFLHMKNRAQPHTVRMIHAAKHSVVKDLKLLAAGFDVDLKPEKEERSKVQRVDKAWDCSADIATVTRILSDFDNWHLTPNGGGIYKVACLCRDYGLSPETATDLMEQLCPIGFDDLDHIASKVRNAYQYATGDAGEKSFAAALEKLDKEELDFSFVDKEEGLFDE